MTGPIIDRRLAGKNKSIGNRERFLRRFQAQIRSAVRDAVDRRGIREIGQPQNVSIVRRDIRQPVFGHGPGGVRETVHPGNSEHLRGDRLPRPKSGGAGAGGAASDATGGEDDFQFTLSKEEFMEFFFEEMELPSLLRSEQGESPEWESRRAGISRDGMPGNLHILRSMRNALGRRHALAASLQLQLQQVTQQLWLLRDSDDTALQRQLRQQAAELDARLHKVPFLDPLDLRYRNRMRLPLPAVNAVMFCLLDVSGSMDEGRKRLAKQFFILLYLFLSRQYEKIEIVFIRHHTLATEVDEETFFHAAESGGTVVSSALALMQEIIGERYPAAAWNVYGAQASDGDNFGDDSELCSELLARDLLPRCRYFAYIQVAEAEQELWQKYALLAAEQPHFALRKVARAADIFPVLHALFRKRQETA